MASRSKKSTKVGAAIFLVIMVAVVVVVCVVTLNKNADLVPLDEVDLTEYTLQSVTVDDEFYVNEPNPSGTLIFRNADGDEKKVSLSEVEVKGFSTKEPGTFTMSVTVGGVTKTVEYTVDYKEIRYTGPEAIYLSIKNPIELDGIYVTCYDYDNFPAATMPLSQLFKVSDFNVDNLNDVGLYITSDKFGYINLQYKVGYIGYDNIYEGRDIVEAAGYSYELDWFLMVETGYDEGEGSMTVYYGDTHGLGDYIDYVDIDFTWEKPLGGGDYLILKGENDNTIGRYHYLEHRLEIGAGVVSHASGLEFIVEYSGPNAVDLT